MPTYSPSIETVVSRPPSGTRLSVATVLLAFGPMLPLVAAGAGAWMLPGLWPLLAIQLAIAWGALILAFVGGVRRGYGFRHRAGTGAVAVSGLYLLLATTGLLLPSPSAGLSVLIVGHVVAALLDRRAAQAGAAPALFAVLRPPQLLLGAAGLAGCWAWLLH